MEGLEVWTPEPRKVAAGGIEVAVRPLPLGRLAPFYRAVRPIAPLLAGGAYTLAIEADTPSVRAVIVAGAEVAPEWVDGLMLDEAIRLLQAVVAVNADFFRGRAAAALADAQAEMRRLFGDLTGAPTGPDGASSSPSSPPGAPPSWMPSS